MWQIDRRWLVQTAFGEVTNCTTLNLSRFQYLVLLGAAGAGKTTETRRLVNEEQLSGRSIRECRLAEYADTTTDLFKHLAQFANTANSATIFYLDALDEAMIPNRRCWIAVRDWIKNTLEDTGGAVRITCRSAVWPHQLSTVMSEAAGKDCFAQALLQPLSDDDIVVAAESEGISYPHFWVQVKAARAQSLATQPLALRMLLNLYKNGGGLPSTLRDLFAQGLRTLASDAQERIDIGTQLDLSPDDLLKAAEPVACYTILTGRSTVNLGDDRTPHDLDWRDIVAVDNGQTSIETLRVVGSSGICDSALPKSFRFNHRQFAEYLAARRLAELLPHQVRGLLASPAGWRTGVAGPLRETASFAAMFNSKVAAWLADQDPEVVGLSDVADRELRRQATLGLLDRFRRGDLTDAQIDRDGIELRGFHYEDADVDLRPVLRERGDRCDDVLECAISLIESWSLSSMSDDLADLVCDGTAPLQSRVAAGYALLRCGTDAACGQLKQLLPDPADDDRDQLRGIALQCNWPDRLSVRELLDALKVESSSSFHGSYAAFLWKLDHGGFAAAGDVAHGLRWAKTRCSDLGSVDVSHRLATRIAHAALWELDDADVAVELVSLLIRWVARHQSPLAPLPTGALDPPSKQALPLNAPLCTNQTIRRQLIELLAESLESSDDMWTLSHRTPGFCNDDDFLWLLDRACDDRRTITARQNYLQITRLLVWWLKSENVDAWLQVCETEPVKTLLGNERSIELGSERAIRLRTEWEAYKDLERPTKDSMVDPPPSARVVNALDQAETRDIRFFRNICRELTLEPTSTHYKGERLLTKTSGWRAADSTTQDRIVEVARRYLSDPVIPSESLHETPINTFLIGGLEAMWLVLERDPPWLTARGESWWQGWCWYILRQLVPNMIGEPTEPKQKLLGILNQGTPLSVSREIVRISASEDTGLDDMLSGLFDLLLGEPNEELDRSLCQMLAAGRIRVGSVASVAQFILTRVPEDAVSVCMRILEVSAEDLSDVRAEHVAVSLLRTRMGDSWGAVKAFLASDDERGRRVLATFAYGETKGVFDSMPRNQFGDLAGLLLQLFPPEGDPHREGANTVEPEDEARTLRDRMISYLGDREDLDAVDALRQLERRFGRRYPWLRRPRARAERAYRLSRWCPLPLDTIADVFRDGRSRLIRSGDEVLEGIEFALDQYAGSMRLEGGYPVEDLWNTPRDQEPSPKSEEHVSRKLCNVIRSYFRDYAVTTDREIEIHRRSVPKVYGGEPGSEVDILVTVPGRGTVSGAAIRVPIEVKLSSNKAAKTSMQDQLVDRYMRQLGATHGVYIVVWMSVPDLKSLQASHQPQWSSLMAAREELLEEAQRLSTNAEICVRLVVVDGSLR